MSDAVRYMADLYRYGQSATVAVITGTVCPCMTSRDSSRPSYSAQWHRDNTAAADCLGTGYITRTTTTTTFYGLFHPVSAIGNSIPMMVERMAAVGEIDENDLMMFGAVKSDGTAFDLSALVERKDKITYDSKTYIVRHVFDLGVSADIGQWALLKRVT